MFNKKLKEEIEELKDLLNIFQERIMDLENPFKYNISDRVLFDNNIRLTDGTIVDRRSVDHRVRYGPSMGVLLKRRTNYYKIFSFNTKDVYEVSEEHIKQKL